MVKALRAIILGQSTDDFAQKRLLARQIMIDMPWFTSEQAENYAAEHLERQKTIKRLGFGATVIWIMGSATAFALLYLAFL